MARILVIDDDDEVRRGVVRMLDRMGHDVEQAADGRQAMVLFEADAPDLVITDINMPEMDGIEVINQLRQMQAGVPIIAMSGGGRMPKEILLSSAGLLGAVGTLEKPFLMADLTSAVEEALASGAD